MDIEIAAINIIPRRPLDDDYPDGYMESDVDFALNNLDVCVWLLEQIIDAKEV